MGQKNTGERWPFSRCGLSMLSKPRNLWDVAAISSGRQMPTLATPKNSRQIVGVAGDNSRAWLEFAWQKLVSAWQKLVFCLATLVFFLLMLAGERKLVN